MDVKIREAMMKDLEVLVKKDSHILEQELIHLITLQRVYVIEEDTKFVGWLRYNLFWDSIPFMNVLYIMEEYRQQGYGKALLTFWEMKMKELKHEVVMTSTVASEYAQHFYHQNGYETIGGFMQKKEYYEVFLEKMLETI